MPTAIASRRTSSRTTSRPTSAILTVDNYAKLPPPLELGDSSKLEQGQWAIAIGEPLQLQQTVTVGVVSGFNRSEPIPAENGGEIDFKGLLQTSAPINPGNSGGPLIDIDGQVIGMNQSTVKSAYAQGIGFAIPSNTVRTVVASLQKNPGVHQGTDTGFLGIYMADLTRRREEPDRLQRQRRRRGAAGLLRLACRPGRHPAGRRDPASRRQGRTTASRRSTTTSHRRSRATRSGSTSGRKA